MNVGEGGSARPVVGGRGRATLPYDDAHERKQMTTITLESPIRRGEQEIREIAFLTPAGTGWLRGVKIFDLAQMDVAALTTVLPRITDPALTEAEIRNTLAAADLFALGAEVVDFLVPKSARAENPATQTG